MAIRVILVEDYDGDFAAVEQYVEHNSVLLDTPVEIKRYGGKILKQQGIASTNAVSRDQPDIIEQIRADMNAAQHDKAQVLLVVDLQIVNRWLTDVGLVELWNADANSFAGEMPIIIYTGNKPDLKKAESPLRQIVSKIDRGSRWAEDELNDAVAKWLGFLVNRANQHA